MKKLRCAIQKSTRIKLEWTLFLLLLHKSHAVRWHYTAESEWRVAEIKSWSLCRRLTDQQACDRILTGRRDPTHWMDPVTQQLHGQLLQRRVGQRTDDCYVPSQRLSSLPGEQRKTIRPFPIWSAKTKWLFGAWNASLGEFNQLFPLGLLYRRFQNNSLRWSISLSIPKASYYNSITEAEGFLDNS